MPRYLINTPTFDPISLEDRLKPIDAYVKTYNALDEDIKKTETLHSLIPSMLDASNEKDRAILDKWEAYNSEYDAVADAVASGDVAAMRRGATALKNNYITNFSNIPVAYAAKQEAIKNSKLPASWIGDRPEYHPTSDFIGTTPTYFGMDTNEVSESAMKAAKGLSAAMEKEFGWSVPSSLYGQYFEKLYNSGAPQEAMNEFVAQIRGLAIEHGADELTANSVADIAIRGMQEIYDNMVDIYHPEKLTSDDDLAAFEGAVINGIQSGISFEIKDKQLQTGVGSSGRSGGHSGGYGGGGGPTNDRYSFDESGSGFSLSGGNNKKEAKVYNRYNDTGFGDSNERVTPQVINGKTVYVSANDVADYNNALRRAENKDNKKMKKFYKDILIEEATEKYGTSATVGTGGYAGLAGAASATREKTPLEKRLAEIDKEIKNIPEDKIRDAYLNHLENKYLHKHDEEIDKYSYLNLGDPLKNAAVGSAIYNRDAQTQMWLEGRAEDSGTYVDNVVNMFLNELEVKHGSEQQSLLDLNGKPVSNKEIEEVLNPENRKNVTLYGNSKYGIVLKYGNKLYLPQIDKYSHIKGVTRSLSTVHQFKNGDPGINSAKEISLNEWRTIENAANRGANIEKASSLVKAINVGNGFKLATFKVDGDIKKIVLNSDGTPVIINGRPLIESALDYADYRGIEDEKAHTATRSQQDIAKYIANKYIDDIYTGKLNTKKSK